ncbi:GNAT family N-acetyltransferase [Bosea sp. 2KB_26]|uniref:GNAT family N-acetyltransferase n=1 Tax=Bosea sp. 2KB_26 TaxID=3237475 RepID=UPI003F8FE583
MIPVLETKRLVMRGWAKGDFDRVAAFLGDEQLTRFVGGASGRDDAWRRFSSMAGHWSLLGFGLWALEAKEDGRLVGWCGLLSPEGWPEPEIGWSLFAGEHGRGYATEAALRARDYAYRDLGWTTLMSFIHPDNRPSIRVAERLGARFEKPFVIRGWEVGIYRHPAAEPAKLKPANLN